MVINVTLVLWGLAGFSLVLSTGSDHVCLLSSPLEFALRSWRGRGNDGLPLESF
jgi:hypothetical protein